MFNLFYNIDFVVAGLLILATTNLLSIKTYSKISRANRLFYVLLSFVMLADFFAIGFSIYASFTNVFPFYIGVIFDLLADISFGIISMLTCRYVISYKTGERTKTDALDEQIAIVLLFVDVLVNIINLFTGIIHTIYDDGSFVKGDFFFLKYLFPALIMFITLIFTLRNRKSFSKSQFRAIIVTIPIEIICVIIEVAIDLKVLVAMFGISISIVIMQYSLETPDYAKLMKTLDALEKAKQDAENSKANADIMRANAENLRIEAEGQAKIALEAQKMAEEAVKASDNSRIAAINANNAKSRFLRKMSHEIRNPLNSVIGMSEMIYMESKEPEIKEYALDTVNASKGLLDIVNDILDYSDLDSGNLKLVEAGYNLKRMLRQIYTVYLFKAREKKLKLVFDIDNSIPDNLIGDGDRIKQILSHLLENAIKYTDYGTVTLKIASEGTGRSSMLLKFTVMDTGRGIREEDMARLFETFDRIDERENGTIEGTGLGINIVSELLTLMGAKLSVDSAYGLGSKFSFKLRQSFSDKTPIGEFMENSEKKIEESKENKKLYAPLAKVLVVDDDSINLRVFCGLLKESGMTIHTANGGKEALEKTHENEYDIIFMDHLMPEMDGFESLRCIRSQSGGLNTETPVVALTANAVSGVEDEYITSGFKSVVFKPTTGSELTKCILNILPNEKISG